jgi:hypothetical protein
MAHVGILPVGAANTHTHTHTHTPAAVRAWSYTQVRGRPSGRGPPALAQKEMPRPPAERVKQAGRMNHAVVTDKQAFTF